MAFALPQQPLLRRFTAAISMAALLAATSVDATATKAALSTALPHNKATAEEEETPSMKPQWHQKLRGGQGTSHGRKSSSTGSVGKVALVRQRSHRTASASHHTVAAAAAAGARRHGRRGDEDEETTDNEGKVVCVDDPSEWRSKTKSTCADYLNFNWCTSSGGYGEGWGDNGDFKAWASSTGISAVEACCSCGGGEQLDISVAKLGAEKCSTGDVIMDVATCEAVSRSLGANFASAAAWPEGHPRGCHTDERRSNVWLNTDPAGVGHDEFSLLCGSEQEDGKDDYDDDDSEDDNDEEGENNQEESDSNPLDALKEKLRQQVVKTHAALVHNMKRRVEIGVELRKLDDEGSSKKEIASSMRAVAQETKSKAMADLLGNMWGEMRMFATPFYEERLDEELVNLEHQEPMLEEAYEKAKEALANASPPPESADQPPV